MDMKFLNLHQLKITMMNIYPLYLLLIKTVSLLRFLKQSNQKYGAIQVIGIVAMTVKSYSRC